MLRGNDPAAHMTAREWMATTLLQGLLCPVNISTWNSADLADAAVKHADALIARLNGVLARAEHEGAPPAGFECLGQVTSAAPSAAPAAPESFSGGTDPVPVASKDPPFRA